MTPLKHALQIIKVVSWTDFKMRYQGSVLGYVWTLIKPLLLFSVLYIVFSVFMRFPVQHYQLYLLLGVILWNFFSEATSIGLQSLLNKSGVLTKLYIPRWTIVVASLITSFITLLLNLVIFFVFLAISPVGFSSASLLFPLFLLELFLIALGCSLILSVCFIHFRDLNHIWEVLIQAGFWLTPIIYPISMVPEKYHYLFQFNPVGMIIDYSRNLFITNEIPSLQSQAILFISTVTFLALGIFIFNHQQKRIIEKI